MQKNNILSIDALQDLIKNRNVFIWGARHDGFAALRVLQRYNIKQTAFIDSSISLKDETAFGLPILMPDTFFSRYNANQSFILIASGFYADEITEICKKNGFSPGVDLQTYSDLRHFNYQIDISGSCNLRCISCPRGNYPEHRKPGFMKPDLYEKAIVKILSDDPYTGLISLYNWGEPLLHRELPEIIKITNKHGLLSAISSNLCLKIDFSNVIKAKPTWFRVSNSGWGANYEKTHTGGDWQLFYTNLFKLREWCDEYHPDMIIEVFFHIYNHNQEDFSRVKKLCEELDFTIRYRHAALAPLDNIEKILEGKPLSNEAEQTRKLQALDVDDVLAIATSPNEINRPCYYENHLWINWDLKIANCMEWYKPGLNLVEGDFLSATMDELISARHNNTFCNHCKARGIHRVYCVYGDESLIPAEKIR